MQVLDTERTCLHLAMHLHQYAGDFDEQLSFLESAIASEKGYFTERFHNGLLGVESRMKEVGFKCGAERVHRLRCAWSETGNCHRFGSDAVGPLSAATLVLLFLYPLAGSLERKLLPVFLSWSYKRELGLTASIERAWFLLNRLTSLALYRRKLSEANHFCNRVWDLLRDFV